MAKGMITNGQAEENTSLMDEKKVEAILGKDGWESDDDCYNFFHGIEAVYDKLVFWGAATPGLFGVGEEGGLVAEGSPIHAGFISTREGIEKEFRDVIELSKKREDVFFDNYSGKLKNQKHLLVGLGEGAFQDPQKKIEDIVNTLREIQNGFSKEVSELLSVAEFYQKNIKDQQSLQRI